MADKRQEASTCPICTAKIQRAQDTEAGLLIKCPVCSIFVVQSDIAKQAIESADELQRYSLCVQSRGLGGSRSLLIVVDHGGLKTRQIDLPLVEELRKEQFFTTRHMQESEDSALKSAIEDIVEKCESVQKSVNTLLELVNSSESSNLLAQGGSLSTMYLKAMYHNNVSNILFNALDLSSIGGNQQRRLNREEPVTISGTTNDGGVTQQTFVSIFNR